MGRCNRSGVDVVFVVEDPSLPLTLFEDKVAWGILQTDTMISTVGKYV
jgi:hypothetical protein